MNRYNDFLNLLLDNPALEQYNFEGNGRIPFPEGSGYKITHPTVYFKYANESDFDELGQLLDDFSQQHIMPNGGVSILLSSWNNKRHKS